MTFDEYLDLLDRLVEDSTLTLSEAEILAEQYDDFDNVEQVLPPESVEVWNENLDSAVTVMLMAFLFSLLRKNTGRENLSGTLSGLRYAQRTALFGTIQESYQQEATRLARDLANGVLSPLEWQSSMNQALLSHFRSVAYSGYRTTALSSAQEVAFQQAVRVQQAYLTRFADQYVLSQIRGTPWTEQYLVNRSAMYAGAMRAFGFRTSESSEELGTGWVIQYFAVDDNRTCSECISAMQRGPYLPGAGPMPGEVCLGKHYCRCNRYPVFDQDAYSRLTA